MEQITDFLISIIVGIVLGIACSVIITAVKKGDFFNVGYRVGKFLTTIGRIKFGRAYWEPVEDALITAFVSFGEGVKSGADSDDGNLTITNKNNGVKQ